MEGVALVAVVTALGASPTIRGLGGALGAKRDGCSRPRPPPPPSPSESESDEGLFSCSWSFPFASSFVSSFSLVTTEFGSDAEGALGALGFVSSAAKHDQQWNEGSDIHIGRAIIYFPPLTCSH